MENTNHMHSEGVSGTYMDWRTHIPLAARQKVVTKIVESLLKHSSAEPQETTKFEDMASKFEEKVFSIAKDKDDYRRMICIKLQQHKKAQRQRSLTSSAPGHTYFVESSLHQALSPLPQFPGHERPLEIQPGLQKHPSSAVMHTLPHQRPVIHHQETPKLTLQQQQDPNAINSWLNVQQKAVPDLRSQHTLYGLNKQSDSNMHQLGQQISTATFNKQFSNFGMQSDQGNIVRISSNNLELQPRAQAQQGQPTLGLQPGSQLSNMPQMRVQPQQNNIQMMAEGTSQTSQFVANDWKEELYDKITKLKDLFLTTLMVQQGKIAEMLQKMDCISHHQGSGEYLRLQKLFHSHKKACSFLNFSKDQMSEEIRIWFPECEKLVVQLLQGRSQGHISSPQQKQLPKSDAQSTKNPALLQPQTKLKMEDGQLQQCRMTDNLVQHKEQRGMQHYQQPVNILAHHSSKFSQALNVNRMQRMESETRNIVHNKCEGNRSLSNAQLVKIKSQSVSTPCNSSNDVHMNNLEKSSQIIGQHSPSPFSVDPPSTSSFQTLRKENQSSGANTGAVHSQATSGAQVSDMPSGLLAENVDGNGDQRHNSTTDLSESSVPEQPIQRLIKSVRSVPHKTFSTSVSDIKSILRMVDRTAGQIPGNGSKSGVHEDLATTTAFYCGLKRDISSQTKHRKLYATTSPSWTGNDGLNLHVDSEAFHLDSLIASPNKKPRIEVNWNLLEEITEINLQLMETVVEISEDDVSSITEETLTESDEGTVVRCFYTPVTTSPNMKSEIAFFQASPIKPLKLLVPISYPADSPVIMDKSTSEISMDCEELSAKAKSKLKLSLQILRQPMSLADIARTWDTCARAVISEFASKSGGGNLSSTYGTWESYPNAA